ncbi:MAG: hypothetical protein Q8P46_10810 [Hyphomicrobiales bacterium]|nr:hypothetical protein [Hyphomicrobiales bacterium]
MSLTNVAVISMALPESWAGSRFGAVSHAEFLSGGDGGPSPKPSLKNDLHLEVPFEIKRRGVETKLVLAHGKETKLDETLVMLIAKAHRWMHQLAEASDLSITALAEGNAEDRNEISRVLPLAFLAPDIVEAILAGTHPVDLTATRLERMSHLPFSWSAQRDLLGFSNSTR